MLPWSTWDDAKLMPSLKYLRGNTGLLIPKEWKDTFPRAFEILHKQEENCHVAAEG